MYFHSKKYNPAGHSLFGSGLTGFDKPDAVGGDAIDPQDADVESGGMAVERDFNLVIVVLVQGDSLLWFFAFLSIVGGFWGLKNVSQARANLMKPGDLSKS